MSAVNVTNVTVFDNPAPFLNPFQFEISYECHLPLEDDLEWKLIYVGSAEDEKYDQVLESVLVGPVNVGNYRFVFQADPPDVSRIPEEDILGVTVMLLTCSYKGQEFMRVGYYVNNDYINEDVREDPPLGKIRLEAVHRNILADKPRVTRFPIVFQQREADNVAVEVKDDGIVSLPHIANEDHIHGEDQNEDDYEDDASCKEDFLLGGSIPLSIDVIAFPHMCEQKPPLISSMSS